MTKTPPRWLTVGRDVVLLVLGLALIIDAAFGPGMIDRVIEIVVGLLLIGVIPLDYLVDRVLKSRSP